jgi:hypothetical protein
MARVTPLTALSCSVPGGSAFGIILLVAIFKNLFFFCNSVLNFAGPTLCRSSC